MYLVTAVFLHPRTVGLGDPLDEQPSRFAGDRNKEAEAPVGDVSGDVAKVLGRARTFAEWVTDHAALFDRTPA